MSFPMQNIIRHHRIADIKFLIASNTSRRVVSFTGAKYGDFVDVIKVDYFVKGICFA
jgi:hypothetical protein